MAVDIEEITDDLSDYADYEEVGSVARARKYITAAKRFLQHPISESDQASSHSFDPASIREELVHARAYVRANARRGSNVSGGAGVKYLGVSDGFRR